MYDKDYWKIEYELEGDKNVIYVMASYKNYDKQKIKSMYNELRPNWKKIKITKVKNLKFKKEEEKDGETRS
jgi:hypothetical protein